MYTIYLQQEHTISVILSQITHFFTRVCFARAYLILLSAKTWIKANPHTLERSVKGDGVGGVGALDHTQYAKGRYALRKKSVMSYTDLKTTLKRCYVQQETRQTS